MVGRGELEMRIRVCRVGVLGTWVQGYKGKRGQGDMGTRVQGDKVN